jgi:ribosomal protein S18 acetylase RimI-like enzyme
MIEEEIPDKNIFMMCKALNANALSELPGNYLIRNCRPIELQIWKGFPFDEVGFTENYNQFMTEFFQTTYGGKEERFFSETKFVCNESDKPIATCLIWKAYDEFNTIQWFKVSKKYEGQGIGRALLSALMKSMKAVDYPIYLHTQPSSYRAIKLYSDFGFYLLSGEKFGNRQNDLVECLPILKEFMPEKDFLNLKITEAPKTCEKILSNQNSVQF